MSIRNKKLAIFSPLIIAIILVLGIYIGIKFQSNGLNERLLLYPHDNKLSMVLKLIENSYVDSISVDKLEGKAIEQILENLDPHSVYIPSEELQSAKEPLEGNFSGIGIQFNIQSDTVIVINTTPNGPAEKKGIKAGDRIVKVNDTVIAGKKLNNEQIIKRLKGKKSTQVKVSVKRNGFAELIDFNLIRDIIPINSIDASYMITDKTGYIKLNKFAKTTYDEFLASVKELHLQGMKKLILDLRGNGGGYMETCIQITDEFLDKGKLIVYTKSRDRRKDEYFSKKGGECLNDSLIVLIDEYSASASEILAGAIQDNDRGIIIGRRSFGKGLVQEPVNLPDGSEIRLTIARYYTPTGRSIQKPYNNGTKDYFDELHKRYSHGELKQADSIKFNKSLKFKTPKGRIVYGGGGIMPDIFVPVDTSLFTEYFYLVREKGWIYNFAFQFSDKNRSDLQKIKTYQEMLDFLKSKNILNEFTAYTARNGLKASKEELKISGNFLRNQLEALIVRNFFDNNGFYPVINSMDNTVSKAVAYFNK